MWECVCASSIGSVSVRREPLLRGLCFEQCRCPAGGRADGPCVGCVLFDVRRGPLLRGLYFEQCLAV